MSEGIDLSTDKDLECPRDFPYTGFNPKRSRIFLSDRRGDFSRDKGLFSPDFDLDFLLEPGIRTLSGDLVKHCFVVNS